jgi:hypothetical protein
MAAAAIERAMPLRAHPVVVFERVQYRAEEAPAPVEVALKAVQHVLGNGCVAHHAGLPEDLEVSGNGGLWKVQDCLEIGDEERSRSQAVQDPEPGRLGHSEQQLGDSPGAHICWDEYT